MPIFRHPLLWLVFLFPIHTIQADTIYDQRKEAYIDTALVYFDKDALPLQAYRGLPLDQTALMNIVNNVPTRGTVDFDLVVLTRLLFLTNGSYDSIILPPMLNLPYWMNVGDTLRGYWSENHMIMWMSTDWLLHERYGKPIDSTLDTRLRHYLRMKLRYGFYEFQSSVYAPYCLSGLLNLADFAQDAEIKQLASSAAILLLKRLLLVANDIGVYYPSAGRNYYSKYEQPYGQNHSNLLYLLNGRGWNPKGTSHSGSFLATSTLAIDSVLMNQTDNIDTSFYIGHPIDSLASIHSVLNSTDKTVAQWSGGLYFHPAVATESANLVFNFDLWNHVDFAPFTVFANLPIASIQTLAEGFPASSEGSVLCSETLNVFKHQSVVLTSVQDYLPGKAGFQQFPCVATVGTAPVMTGSGTIKYPWKDRNSNNANEHLPYVQQKHNVALLMYRPEGGNLLLRHPEVALMWPDTAFNEIRENGLWLLGRQNHNYVAVLRPCIDSIDGVKACHLENGQAWVIVVGDSAMYGNFNNFENLVSQASLTENWYVDSNTEQSVYYASIQFDTTFIEHAWERDTLLTSVPSITTGAFNIYPNPAENVVNVDLKDLLNARQLNICNVLGQTVYQKPLLPSEKRIAVSVSDWNKGLYFIQVLNNDGVKSGSFIVE
ncbi:MAG: T9SS type A sorting domain-containing protein [Chitinophagales bacterium]|nr:T9SS type A sorting domain-containing protein [Chitinophagales bacterium]